MQLIDPRPPISLPVTTGTILFTNAPDGALIKPPPVEFTAIRQLGSRSGWLSLDDAVAAVQQLTAGDLGAAAIVRSDDRYVAHSIRSSWFGEPHATLTSSIRNFGGLPWVHDDVAAFVDGTWVEHFGH